MCWHLYETQCDVFLFTCVTVLPCLKMPQKKHDGYCRFKKGTQKTQDMKHIFHSTHSYKLRSYKNRLKHLVS